MLTLNLPTNAFTYPEMEVPDVWTIRQKGDTPALADIEGAARKAARALFADPRLKPGASVATSRR